MHRTASGTAQCSDVKGSADGRAEGYAQVQICNVLGTFHTCHAVPYRMTCCLVSGH